MMNDWDPDYVPVDVDFGDEDPSDAFDATDTDLLTLHVVGIKSPDELP